MLASTRSPAKTGHRQPKSAKFATHSAEITSFRPLVIASGPHQRLTAFHIENHVFAKAFENLHFIPFQAKL
jgi:hypothetical protein